MLPYLYSIRKNLSLLEFQKTKQNINHGGFARTCGSHNSYRLSDGNNHVRMIKNQHLGIGIFIYNIFQLDAIPDLHLLHFMLLTVDFLVIIYAFIPDILL